MHEPDLIDHYVFGLWRLMPLQREVTERILEEVEGHLRSSVEREVRAGTSQQEAQRHAIEYFGPLDDIAARLLAAHRPGELARVWELWNRLHPVLRIGIAITVLVLPWNTDAFHGGRDVGAPMFVGALLLGLLAGYLSDRRGQSVGAALASAMAVCVFSFAVVTGLDQKPIRDPQSAVMFAKDFSPLALIVVGYALVGVIGSALGGRLRHAHLARIGRTADA
jgi:hypothetical protein